MILHGRPLLSPTYIFFWTISYFIGGIKKAYSDLILRVKCVNKKWKNIHFSSFRHVKYYTHHLGKCLSLTEIYWGVIRRQILNISSHHMIPFQRYCVGCRILHRVAGVVYKIFLLWLLGVWPAGKLSAYGATWLAAQGTTKRPAG